jgi:hypothetical protein
LTASGNFSSFISWRKKLLRKNSLLLHDQNPPRSWTRASFIAETIWNSSTIRD